MQHCHATNTTRTLEIKLVIRSIIQGLGPVVAGRDQVVVPTLHMATQARTRTTTRCSTEGAIGGTVLMMMDAGGGEAMTAHLKDQGGSTKVEAKA